MNEFPLAPEFELTPQREQLVTIFLTEVIAFLPFPPHEQALLVQELPQMTPSLWEHLLCDLFPETLAQMPRAEEGGEADRVPEAIPQWRMTGVPGGPEGEGVEPEPPKVIQEERDTRRRRGKRSHPSREHTT
jgi:hypothetical protein